MRKPSVGITAEGLPSIFLCTLAAIIFSLIGCWFMGVVFLLLTWFACHFFRDPERVVVKDPGTAVSPADGKVIRIANMPDPINGEMRQCISIFMNVFNVHVNRMPVDAAVTDIVYKEGRFLNAGLDKASEDNERCNYRLEDENGDVWYMVQIAGLVARRIVCRVDEGDSLKRGERYGMIKFGSRVDLYLPENYAPAVLVGDVVYSGQSVLARTTKA